eukprot:8077021-Lingulodinium_polyedra.AAC.1
MCIRDRALMALERVRDTDAWKLSPESLGAGLSGRLPGLGKAQEAEEPPEAEPVLAGRATA